MPPPSHSEFKVFESRKFLLLIDSVVCSASPEFRCLIHDEANLCSVRAKKNASLQIMFRQ